jgi:integrase
MKAAKRRPRGSVYEREDSPYLWLEYSNGGRKVRESTGQTSYKKAKKLLDVRLGEIAEGRFLGLELNRVMVGETEKGDGLADDFFRYYRSNNLKSIDDAKARWNLHLKPCFGGMRAMQVSPELIARYVQSRQEQHAANGTINRELAALKRMFSLGREHRKVREVPTFPKLKESPPRKGFLQDDQYRKLIEGAKLWFRSIVECGRTYGWRISEVLGLRVGQVDLLSRTVRLNPGETKNDEGRVVVMTDAVFLLLSECVRGKSSDAYVFTRPNGKRVVDFRLTWADACCRAGLGKLYCPKCKKPTELTKCSTCSIEWKRKELIYRGLIFHDLRRSGVRDMVRNGIPERVAMTISGHKTRSIFDRYNIVNEDDLRDAAAKMNRRDEKLVLSHDSVTPEPLPKADAVN